MRWLSSTLIVLILCVVCSTATAQYERFRLPEGTRLVYQDETYQAFNLGEYQELLHMDNDLRHFTQLLGEREQQIQQLTIAVENLQRAVALSEEVIAVLQEDRAELQSMWEEENRLRHIAEQAPDGAWVPWAISGVLAAAVVALGIAIGVM